MADFLTTGGLDRLEALTGAILEAYLDADATGEGLSLDVDVDAAKAELADLIARHRDTLAAAGVGFVFDLARALVDEPGSLQDLDFEEFEDAELAALAEAGADRVQALRHETVTARQVLVAELAAIASRTVRGALAAALMAAVAI
jgi:hypothetical protein